MRHPWFQSKIFLFCMFCIYMTQQPMLGPPHLIKGLLYSHYSHKHNACGIFIQFYISLPVKTKQLTNPGLQGFTLWGRGEEGEMQPSLSEVSVFQSDEDGNGWAFPKRYQSEVLSENQLVRQDVFSRGEVWSDCSSLPSGNLAPGSHVSALHGQWPGKARVVKDTMNCHIYLFEKSEKLS